MPLSSEDLELIKSLALWMKVMNSGLLALFVVILWRAFKLYSRLQKVEDAISALNPGNFVTRPELVQMQSDCRFRVSAEIDSKDHVLHINIIEELQSAKKEIAAVRESQCHILGQLTQIGKTLSALDLERAWP